MTFDPYYHWLSIPPEDQPPTLYRLLGVKALEQNLDVISNAADRQMKHLRDCQTGTHGDLSQKLLNELAAARNVLLNPEKKAAYDHQLTAASESASASAPQPPIAAPTSAVSSPAAPRTVPEQKPATPLIQTDTALAGGRSKTSVPLMVAAAVGLVLLLLTSGVVGMAFLWNGERIAESETGGLPNDEAKLVDASASETTNTLADTNSTEDTLPASDTANDDDPSAGMTESPVETATQDPVDIQPQSPITEVDTTAEPAEPVVNEEKEEPAEQVAMADAPEPAKKPAVPPQDERQKKREEILDIFATDSMATAEEKAALANKLIQTADETKDDLVGKYVMYDLARELAIEMGQLKLAFSVAEKLAEGFEVDAVEASVESVNQISRAALPKEVKTKVVSDGLEFIDQLVAVDRFREADLISDRLLSIARSVRDAELIKVVVDQKRGNDALAAKFNQGRLAFQKLRTTPDDAAANAAVGYYFTFVKFDLKSGFPYLAKGEDAKLAATAQGELASPAEAAAQMELADAWWEVAESERDERISNFSKARAGYWYKLAMPELTGISRVKAEQRIKEAPDMETVAGSVRPSTEIPVKTPNYQPGLVVYEYARVEGQEGDKGYVHPSNLGDPVGAPKLIKSVATWTYEPSRNAAAIGFIKIDEPGEYAFKSYNYYDRNALFINDQLVCKYRDGDRPDGEKISLPAGMIPFMSVSYVDARGKLEVTKWKPPGASEFTYIPSELLMYDPATVESK